ncbi:Plug domain-containing protein [Muriicola sp. Z0-33]|uniref:Plug domain-containing protein n=1 Tax=Muriicola sp. Z0-33 TaxID=2816957 RepID=UPI0022383C89|nr:Plug domain-containing protein [Muriicola sp. Z0-33]MCW5517414.1 Plug domain-containing protein [Muriicola sp. Z0-33]
MKKTLLLSLVMVSLFVSALTAQRNSNQVDSFYDLEYGELTAMQNNQIADSLFQWREHIDLHLDKTKVQPTDYVFFKAYLFTGPEQLRGSASSVLKIELLDETGNLVKRQYHKITDGTADGSMQIPKRLKGGNYFFRAYTRWMLNYDAKHLVTKKLQIGKIKDIAKIKSEMPSKVSAFPEGGNLVAGLVNKVVIASDDGDLDGSQIVDEKGNVVASVTSYGRAGTTIFTPKKGTSYAISQKEQILFQLPVVQDIGYTLQINNLAIDKAFVRIASSPERIGKPMILKGVSDNATFFETRIEFNDNISSQIEISKTDLPRGVIDIILVDEADNVWAQRPISIEKDEYSIAVQNIKPSDGIDNASTFEVVVTDEEGRPVQTSLSVSLSGLVESEEHLIDVWLSGEGNGNLRNQRYSGDLKLLSSKSLDELSNQDAKQSKGKIKYNFQKGLDFYGQAYDLNGRLLTNTKIQVIIMPEDNAIAKEVTTNSDGLFKLSDMDFEGEAKAVFRTAGENTKEKLVKVVPYENETPPLAEIKKNVHSKNAKSMAKDITVARKSAADFLAEDEEGLVNLDEIILVADKSEKEFSPSQYGIEPTRKILQDSERPKTLEEMFLNVPGFNVADLGGLNPRLVLPRAAGMGPILWVIDGFPIEQTNSLRDIISIVPYVDIERIEILIGPAAAAYGSRAAGAVILIYTRSGSDEAYFSRKHTQLTYNGYHNSIDFGSYNEEVRPTLRTLKNSEATLYWNPNITTDVEGRARIKLSVPETYNKLRLGIKGVNPSGKKANVETVITL